MARGRKLLAAYIGHPVPSPGPQKRAGSDLPQMSAAFFHRTDSRAPLVRNAVQKSIGTPSTGLLFLTGKLAAQVAMIADDLAAHDLETEWLIVCGVGVLSPQGEIEGESGGVGLRLPMRAQTVLTVRGDTSFGQALLSQMAESAGSTACVFLRGDARDDTWLAEVRSASTAHQEHIYGGGSLPGAQIYRVRRGKVTHGMAAALVFPGRTRSQISTSSACRLLSPLGEITRSQGSTIQEIDHAPALARLGECTSSLEEGSLVLLAIGAGERPLDPAGRTLALRPILGVDPTAGSIVIDEPLPAGSAVAFAVRDGHGARSDFEAHLRSLRSKSAGSAPGFGIYVACAGRGRSLYKSADVDSRLIAAQFPNMPFVGLQTTYEFAPLDKHLTPQVYAGVLGVFSSPS